MISFKTGFYLAIKSFQIIKKKPLLLLYMIIPLIITIGIPMIIIQLLIAFWGHNFTEAIIESGIVSKSFIEKFYRYSLYSLPVIVIFFESFFRLLLTYHTAWYLDLFTGTFWGGLKKKVVNIIGLLVVSNLIFDLMLYGLIYYDVGPFFVWRLLYILFPLLLLYAGAIIIVEPINIFQTIRVVPKILARTFKGLLGAGILTYIPGSIPLPLLKEVFATATAITILLLYLEYKKQFIEK